jgi:hypothetical protein
MKVKANNATKEIQNNKKIEKQIDSSMKELEDIYKELFVDFSKLKTDRTDITIDYSKLNREKKKQNKEKEEIGNLEQSEYHLQCHTHRDSTGEKATFKRYCFKEKFTLKK